MKISNICGANWFLFLWFLSAMNSLAGGWMEWKWNHPQNPWSELDVRSSGSLTLLVLMPGFRPTLISTIHFSFSFLLTPSLYVYIYFYTGRVNKLTFSSRTDAVVCCIFGATYRMIDNVFVLFFTRKIKEMQFGFKPRNKSQWERMFIFICGCWLKLSIYLYIKFYLLYIKTNSNIGRSVRI